MAQRGGLRVRQGTRCGHIKERLPTGRRFPENPVCSIAHHLAARGRYTSRVVKKRDAGLERIRRLEEQLSRAPVNSGRSRLLARAIRIEAELYRKSLDTAQGSN